MGFPPFFVAKSYFLRYLERHAKIQNRRQTPFGRKVNGRKERRKKERRRKRRIMPSVVATTSAFTQTHNVCAHALRSHQLSYQPLSVCPQLHLCGQPRLNDLVFSGSFRADLCENTGRAIFLQNKSLRHQLLTVCLV